MRDLTVADILSGEHQWNDLDRPLTPERGLPETILGTTLQDLLLLIVSAFVCDLSVSKESEGSRPVLGSGKVRPGFSKRFAEALVGPTPGKLLPFAVWLATEEPSCHALTGLREYLINSERKPTGWLSQLSQLRNRWAHPEGSDPADTLAQVAALVTSLPPSLLTIRVRLESNGNASWIDGSAALPLAPFTSCEDTRFLLFGGLGPANRLVFPAAADPSRDRSALQDQFAILWRQLRALDMALSAPTSEDFQSKTIMTPVPPTADAPWWIEEVWRPGPLGFLVPPAHADAVLASAAVRPAAAGHVRLVPTPGQEPKESLAQALGLAAGPSASELLSLLGDKFDCVFIVDASDLSAKDFLQQLYWAADLAAAGNTGSLRLVIEREGVRLAQDQEKLWDRLPERLETILRKPPGSGGNGLTQYLWPAEKPKKRFGLF